MARHGRRWREPLGLRIAVCFLSGIIIIFVVSSKSHSSQTEPGQRYAVDRHIRLVFGNYNNKSEAFCFDYRCSVCEPVKCAKSLFLHTLLVMMNEDRWVCHTPHIVTVEMMMVVIFYFAIPLANTWFQLDCTSCLQFITFFLLLLLLLLRSSSTFLLVVVVVAGVRYVRAITVFFSFNLLLQPTEYLLSVESIILYFHFLKTRKKNQCKWFASAHEHKRQKPCRQRRRRRRRRNRSLYE